MSIRLVPPSDDCTAYAAWVASHPQGSLWQSPAWKTYQEALGREVRIYIDEENGAIRASALVVIDRTAWNLSSWELPRGPLWDEAAGHMPHALLEQIMQDARRDRCITLYTSPVQSLEASGVKLEASRRHIQPTATRILDLTKSDEEILAQMKPKGRYNIGVAAKHGVTTEESDDISAFYSLLTATAARDRFRPLRQEFYETFLKKLPGAFLLLARHPDAAEPVAGLIGVVWGTTGIYYYGASSYEHRALMAPYGLQWAALQRCKAAGCTQYDLLGVAPPDSGPEHPWQGVSTFKEKFGGMLVTYPQERRKTFKPVIRSLLALKRRFG